MTCYLKDHGQYFCTNIPSTTIHVSIDWRGYLNAVRDGISSDHEPHALPRPVLDAIKPVFEKLCSRESLERVIDASSQNPNEGFHSIVWLMSSKHKASSGTTFEIAYHLAIIIFKMMDILH